jgi:lysozyme
MNIGPAGIALIKSYEKCRLAAYMPTPNDVPTIGWGHTKGVKMGDTCTQADADAWFLEDIQWVQDCVNLAVPAQLLQNEFDALCSLCFNIGCTAFSKSTLVRSINAGDFDTAAKLFLDWNKQNHVELAGLTARRAKEQQLFETAVT